MKKPVRGEVWFADLNPVVGHEQGGLRPVLVVSADIFNKGPAGLAIILPITKTYRDIPVHVGLKPPEAGIRVQSFILCDAVRSVSQNRLVKRWGKVLPETMEKVEYNLRVLMEL